MDVNLPDAAHDDVWLNTLEDLVAETGERVLALADQAGVLASTVRRWLEQGREDYEAGIESGARNLFEAVELGMSRHILDSKRRLRNFGEAKRDWKAEQYLLSVADPDTFHLPARTRENESTSAPVPEQLWARIRAEREALYREKMEAEEQRAKDLERQRKATNE